MPAKDDSIRVRVTPELKEAFTQLCEKLDLNGSSVIRDLMRDWLYRNSDADTAKRWKARPGERS